MTETALVAVLAEPTQGFFDQLSEIWAREEAILPVDPRLPKAKMGEILDRFRPARFVQGETSQSLPGALPVSADIRAVVLTSGTSGEPKGVELSLSAFTSSWTASAAHLGADDSDVWMCCLPPAHIAGLSVLVRSVLSEKRPIIQAADQPNTLKGATLVSMVPTQLSRLLQKGTDLAGLKAVLLGGGRIPQGLLNVASEAGIRVVSTYGMTETCGGCVYDGRPLEGVDVRVDDEGGIAIRGEVLFRRYHQESRLTRDALRGGWFLTGDIGFFGEDAELVVMGRRDTMIISGGEKVAPSEVESILFEHPKVLDCAVTGIPDDEWGEAVAVAIVVEPGEELTLEEVRAFVKDRAAAYKAPRRLVKVDSVPRSSIGKPLKEQIRSLF